MTVTLNLAVTQGDPFYHEIAYTDVYGAPIDLTGWSFAIDFRSAFASSTALASLALSSGITFLNDDPTTGVLILQFDDTVMSSLPMPTSIRPGFSAPFTTVYGDIKATPPSGTELTTDDGTRPVIQLRVNAAVTS